MVIHRQKGQTYRVLYSQKTVYPALRHLGPREDASKYEDGEFVGTSATPGRQVRIEKVTAANQYAQAMNAAMRVGDTTNDVLESGAVTVYEGYFHLETTHYLAGSYAKDDLVTLRYDATNDKGVLGPVDGSTTHVLGQVVVPPADGSKNTPMVVKLYGVPVTK